MNWFGRLLRRSRMEDQLERELSFHLEFQIADLIEHGHTPEEARRLARLALGGPEQVKENCRDARGTRWLEDFFQDVRYALRSMRQNPGFAAVALLTLSLGAGAATVMFSVIDGVLLKPFPYRDPARLLCLSEQTDWSTATGNIWGFSYPNYLDCKRDVPSLDFAVSNTVRGTLSKPGQAAYLVGAQISSGLFQLLGIGVAQGRGFTAQDDAPGAPPVAIISQAVWERRFNASAGAIGSQLIFDGTSWTIIGVMPPGFRLDDNDLDLYTPIGHNTSSRMRNRGAHGLQVWARLRPGATVEQARAALAVVGRRLAAQYPDTNKGRAFIADPLRPIVGNARSTLWLLFGAVAAVLLIACVNIASLLLARAASRERELAMRAALGARRGRLVRQCLTESAVLALTGGAVGIALASLGLKPFIALWPGGLPRAWEVGLDWRVLLFSLGVSLLSGLLFGVAPALRSPRNLARNSRPLHGTFAICEVALALILLVCAGTLIRTLLNLSALDPGMNIHNVLTARFALAPTTLTNPGRTRAAWQDLLDRARQVPA